MAAIHGSEAVGNEGRRLLTFYLEVILKPNLRGSRSGFSHHTAREFVTLASAMDALLECDTAKAGDILIGRFKVLEEATTEGSWRIAQEFEVVPQEDEGFVGHEERYRAAYLQLRSSKLRSYMYALSKGQQRRNGG